MNAEVEFEVGEAGISDDDFRLTAYVTDQGIEVSLEAILGIILEYFKELRIYPNPLRGNTIQLRTSGKQKGEAMTLRIINLQGRLVKEQYINADAFGNVDLQIDVNNLHRNGTYIVELISKSDTEFVKVFSE